jgi:hypothetical protein
MVRKWVRLWRWNDLENGNGKENGKRKRDYGMV